MSLKIARSGLALCAVVAMSIVLAGPVSAADDGFHEIRVAPGLAEANQFIDTIRPFLLDYPKNLEGKAAMTIDIRKGDGGFDVDIVKTGYLDDSVEGEQFRGFVIRTSKGTWELLSLSVKTLCYRGTNPDGKCL